MVLDILTWDDSDGGIFLFDKAGNGNIKKINFCGLKALQEKGVELISYLLLPSLREIISRQIQALRPSSVSSSTYALPNSAKRYLN